MNGKLLGVSIVVVLLLGLILFTGLYQLGVVPTAKTEGLPHLIINVQASDPTMVSYVLSTSVMNYLKAGDTIDITHDGHNPVTASVLTQINQEAQQFAAAAPSGTIIGDHTFYVPVIGALANGSNPPISQIAATLEPNGATTGLSYTFSAALAYFNETTVLAHHDGLQSVGYPSGSFLLNGALLQYGWNYGQLAATVDKLWVELQGYDTGSLTNSSQWSLAITKLISQMNGAGQPLSKLAIQIILGDASTLGVAPAQALAAINVATGDGITNIDLWMSGGYESYLGTVLSELNRTAVSPPPPPCCIGNGGGPVAGLPILWIEAGVLVLGAGLAVWLIPGYWRLIGVPFLIAGVVLFYISVGGRV